MSRKSPWLRRRVRRALKTGKQVPAGKLLLPDKHRTSFKVVDAPDDGAVPSHKVTRTGWMDMHPRFHDPLHATRKKSGFKPWYGDHNEHKPPKVKA